MESNYIILTTKNADVASTQFKSHVVDACKDENIEWYHYIPPKMSNANNTSSCVFEFPEIKETHRFIFVSGRNLRFTHHDFENVTYRVMLEDELYFNYMLLDVVIPHMVVRKVNN